MYPRIDRIIMDVSHTKPFKGTSGTSIQIWLVMLQHDFLLLHCSERKTERDRERENGDHHLEKYGLVMHQNGGTFKCESKSDVTREVCVATDLLFVFNVNAIYKVGRKTKIKGKRALVNYEESRW